jgi:proto-oncogene C-crk
MAQSLADYPWYHGRIDRGTTESILRGRRPGLFLVRDSTSCPGDFVLSVSESGKVSHYIINRRGGIYIIGDQTFPTLPEVIEFYRKHFLDTTTLIEIASRQGPLIGTGVPPANPSALPVTSYPPTIPFTNTTQQTSVMPPQPSMVPPQPHLVSQPPMMPAQQPLMPAAMGLSHPVAQPPMQPMQPMQQQFPTQPPEQTLDTVLETVEAVYKFESDDSEDLPFQKGDIMYILKKEEEAWWLARHSDGRVGLIPVPYIKQRKVIGGMPPRRTESVMHPRSQPPQHQRSPPLAVTPNQPVRARAIMDRVANAYDNTALSFKVRTTKL